MMPGYDLHLLKLDAQHPFLLLNILVDTRIITSSIRKIPTSREKEDGCDVPESERRGLPQIDNPTKLRSEDTFDIETR